jgi:hypothetical protein
LESSITYNEIDGFILISHDGILDEQALRKSISQTIKAGIKYKCFKSVIDCRNTRANMKTMEVFNIQQFLTKSLPKNNFLRFKLKRAFVLGEDEIVNQSLDFFETLSINRNQRVRLFNNMNDAISWIKED